MSNDLVVERNLLVPMSDGVHLAADLIRPGGGHRHPVLVNYNPYHKDGRGGRLAVESVHRHFAALGYACLTLDFRGLGNSSGRNPEPFAPQEARDGYDAVEWIAAQPWCDGNVGMWGVSYPGITALSTAALRPPHLKAIVPIHATSDLYRGVVGLGGCASGFWMRADWGPRMIAYNLSPPLLQDPDGRWAKIWAEHLEGNDPWVTAFADHPGFDEYWQSRVARVADIECPTFLVCGWRDLYADDTPRDFNAIPAPRKLLMGPWKHEFPDTGREAPAAGLWDMQRWFDRWLKGIRNGIETEPPVSIHVQGANPAWRAETQFPPARLAPCTLFFAADGTLDPTTGGAGHSDHAYDPTVGMQSLAWDPWTTSLDPTLPRDQSADDARSLCFTSAPLTEPMELIGMPHAVLEVSASAVPLHLVVKLAAVAPNGRSTLITSGWTDLAQHGQAGAALRVEVPLRATAYRLEPGERLRIAVACADFPRLWPTPLPATLRLAHGKSHVTLPVCPPPAGDPRPIWGRLQPDALAAPADLGGEQVWDLARDLMTDTVRLAASKTERVRLDATTTVASNHHYGAAVSAARPDLARMHSTTEISVERPVGRIALVARTVTTAQALAVDVDITVDGQPFWHRRWNHRPAG